MNTNFDNLMKQAKSVLCNTVDTAKQLGNISKYKVQIAAEQEKIRKLYHQLGKLYYKDYVTDEEPDEAEYQPLCSGISAHYRKIAALREMIEEIKSNPQGVKEETMAKKQAADAEETALIRCAMSESAADSVDPLADEEDLLEELNSLNLDSSFYGEIPE